MEKKKKMKIIRKKLIKKSFRKYRPKKQKNFIYTNLFKKILFILILSFLTIILYFYPNKKSIIDNEKIENKEEKIDYNNPLEHYRMLLPKIKYHNLKKYNLEERPIVFKLEDSIDNERMKNKKGNDSHIYFSCLLCMYKGHNLYAKEYIDHYLSIGVDKIYIGDDDPPEHENIGDILDDYVKKGVLDIEYIFTRNMSQIEFYQFSFNALKDRCKWLLYFDQDEFLEFIEPNMTIQSYLNMPRFDNCDVVRVHWKNFDDNNLLYYDERPLKERFPHGLLHNKYNIYHKSLIRGKNYKDNNIWNNPHQPDESKTIQCNAIGNREYGMGPQHYEFGWLKHYTTKTAEEFAMKILRGSHQGGTRDKYIHVRQFFEINEFKKEKMDILEHILNQTFPELREEFDK